jgi:secondary thiamine-phosphate synthase enzyme
MLRSFSLLLLPSLCLAFSTMPSVIPLWFQHEISITAPSRGCHLITSTILKTIASDLPQIDIGLCNLFVQHTSASLTINENADPDVRRDMEVALNNLVPAEWCRNGLFRHTMEGDDDMPGHVKSSLMGTSITIPVRLYSVCASGVEYCVVCALIIHTL